MLFIERRENKDKSLLKTDGLAGQYDIVHEILFRYHDGLCAISYGACSGNGKNDSKSF